MTRPKKLLPFETILEEGQDGEGRRRVFWRGVVSSGDYHQDTDVGRQCAYLALQRLHGFTPLLGWMVIDMMTYQCPKGIVIGFCQTIADCAMGHRRAPGPDAQLALPKLVFCPQEPVGKAVKSARRRK